MTHPTKQPAPKEITVGEALRWSDKHLKLKGEGVRVVHIKHLLQQALVVQKSAIVERIKGAINFMGGLHRVANSTYHKDSWDAGWHDALFKSERKIADLIRQIEEL